MLSLLLGISLTRCAHSARLPQMLIMMTFNAFLLSFVFASVSRSQKRGAQVSQVLDLSRLLNEY